MELVKRMLGAICLKYGSKALTIPVNSPILIGMKHNYVCRIDGTKFSSQQPNAVYCSIDCRNKSYAERQGRISDIKIPSGTAGAISEILVSADLMAKGYAVFRALSMSCFCDIISIKDKNIYRIEVRTGYISGSGTVSFDHNTHGEIDLFGVYVPRKKECYYFNNDKNQVYL